jgi:electron transport complex protein RnfG
MKKLESSLKNMALALTGFSVVAGGLLGWVNDVTAEPIAQANAKTLSDAIAVVVPGFDNNPAEAPETVEVNGATYKIYKATKNGQPIGAAVESAANGFGSVDIQPSYILWQLRLHRDVYMVQGIFSKFPL